MVVLQGVEVFIVSTATLVFYSKMPLTSRGASVWLVDVASEGKPDHDYIVLRQIAGVPVGTTHYRPGTSGCADIFGRGRSYLARQAGSFMCVARIRRSDSGSFITESCAFFRKPSYSRAIAGETTS